MHVLYHKYHRETDVYDYIKNNDRSLGSYEPEGYKLLLNDLHVIDLHPLLVSLDKTIC